jgi:hypothetical protein
MRRTKMMKRLARIVLVYREAILAMREMKIASKLDSYLDRGDMTGYEEFAKTLPQPSIAHGLSFVSIVWDGFGPFAKKEVRDFFLNRIWAASPDPGWLVRRIIWEYEKKERWEDALVTCRFWLSFDPQRTEAIQLLNELEGKVHKEKSKQS